MKIIRQILLSSAVCFCAASTVRAELLAGYARYDITPPLGTSLAGYGTERPAVGVRDPLSAVAVAFSDGRNKAVVIALDLLTLWGYHDVFRAAVAEGAGLDPQAVFITCTHTHTGPDVGWSHYTRPRKDFNDAILYTKFLRDCCVSVARLALNDLSPARLSTARGEAKGVSFIRRFRMKDGTSVVNPGYDNPEVAGPIGNPDEEVLLVRVDRPGKDALAIVNFQCHPDTVGGRLISRDWPGVVRDTVEQALGDVKCLFLNGMLGDVNHVCTDLSRSRLSPTEQDRFYRYFGRVVAGGVIGIWDICKPVKGEKVGYGVTVAQVKTARGSPEILAKARRIMDLVRQGREAEVSGKGRRKKALIARARMVEYLANGPDFLDFPLSAVTVGEAVAFVGFPGEPFTEYGVLLKKESPFAMTMPVSLTNGMYGYLPLDANLNEPGYGTQGALFAKGLQETMLGGHLRQLRTLAGKAAAP